MPCIKHNYIYVNNRYLNGKIVTQGGKWVTERRCSECDELAPIISKLKIYE